jgi:hypothetical protein
VRDERGTGSPSSPAPAVGLPYDIIERVARSSALTLRDLARLAGTCKLFQKALLERFDAEVQWLTDLTHNAIRCDAV